MYFFERNKSVLTTILLVTASICLIFFFFYFVLPQYYRNNINCQTFKDLNFSPDGQFLSVSTFSNHIFYSSNNGKIILKTPCNCAEGITYFSPNSRYSACISRGSYNIVDILQKKVAIDIGSLTNTGSSAFPENFSPDNKYVYFSEQKSNLFLNTIDIVSGKVIEQQLSFDHELQQSLKKPTAHAIFMLHYAVKGNWLVFLYTSQSNKYVLHLGLYNLKSNVMTSKMDIPWKNQYVSGGRSGGDKIIMPNGDTVLSINISKEEYINIPFNISNNTPYCISYDGKCLAVLNIPSPDKLSKQVVDIFDTESGKLICEIPLKRSQFVNALAVHPEKKLLAVGYGLTIKTAWAQKGKHILYDIDTKREILELKRE